MSETTTTTGWHRHEKTGTIHQAAACFLDDAHPVIWLDPADPAVREIDAAARVIAAYDRETLAWDALDGKPHVRDSDVKAAIRERHRDAARRVLAALASATEGADRG